MKKCYFIIFIVLFASTNVCAQAFITTWNTANTSTGSTNNKTITIPGSGNGYSIAWQELSPGTSSGTTTGTYTTTLTFPETGIYRVSITPGTGTFTAISFGGAGATGIGDSLKLTGVTQWGSINWSDMLRAFYGCANLTITATDIPNLTAVTNMGQMFENCRSITTIPNIGSWNVSNVTIFDYIFHNAINFNSPLNTWNVNNATSMGSMFQNASSFNQPLNNWNTANVTDMDYMFYGASAFNQNINSWDVSKVTFMYNMFYGATSFNQPLNNWNTGNVTDMTYMFYGASAFNQNINSWNVSKVVYVHDMFQYASSFNQPLNNWNTASLTDPSFMFYGATSFNQPLNNWNTSNVTSMNSMFAGASAFNQPLNSWDVSKVIALSGMFRGASAFNQSLRSWNLKSATSISGMFNNSGLSCANYSSTLQGWAKNAGTPSNLTLSSASPLHYGVSAQPAHNYLTGTKGWTIAGDTYDATCPGADVINGVIWDDANGDGIQQAGENGTGLASSWIYLVSTANIIVDSSAVSSTGNYTFYNYTAGSNYNVILDKTARAIGTSLSASTLNNGWANVSFNAGTATPNTTGVNSVTAPAIGSITTANVGVDQRPVAYSQTINNVATWQYNIAYNASGYPSVASTYKGILASKTGAANTVAGIGSLNSGGNSMPLLGTDADGTVTSFTIGSVSAGTLLYYNNGSGWSQLVAGSTLPINYDPTKLVIYASTSGTTAGASFTYYAIDNAGVQSGSPATFTLNTPNALPVTLNNFSVRSVNCQAIVTWTGTIENNFNYYEVQQSVDDQSFTAVEKIAGKGNGANYMSQFALVANNEFVRLKMTDNNGTVTYSDVLPISSNCTGSNVLIVYPNPITSQLTVSNMGAGNKTIRVISVNGAIVYKGATTAQQLNINVQNWSAGVYMVSVQIGNGMVNTVKVVKK